jgi:alpha-1,6-mannosyltransferase
VKLLDITEYHSPVGGGVTTYLRAKARWLSRRTDVEHVIVLSGARDAEERWDRSRVYYVGGPPVPASPGFYFLLAPGRLRGIVRRERPDVIELGSPFLARWLVAYAARGQRTALVGYFHDNLETVWVDHGLQRAPPVVRGIGRAIVGSYVRLAYRSMAHTIAPTRAAAAALTRLGIAPVSTVPLGVDTEAFHPRWRDPDWRADVGATGGAPVGLYVGRLAREKEIALLVSALPALAMEHRLKVVMIGEGHMRAALEALARAQPDRLAVLPFEADRARLARAYASADLFINPCPYETFGLATVEAMASGLPVVAPAAAGSADLLAQGGGELFAPQDAGDLVRAVGRVLAADRASLRAAARRAAEGLSWDRAFSGLMAIYERLVNA